MQGTKRGIFSAEDLQARERKALNTLRDFDRGEANLFPTLDAVMDYHQFLIRGETDDEEKYEKALAKTRANVQRTLEEAPWKRCPCAICSKVGVEVIIFRASNRNKRRGFHNLGVYHRHLQRTIQDRA